MIHRGPYRPARVRTAPIRSRGRPRSCSQRLQTGQVWISLLGLSSERRGDGPQRGAVSRAAFFYLLGLTTTRPPMKPPWIMQMYLKPFLPDVFLNLSVYGSSLNPNSPRTPDVSKSLLPVILPLPYWWMLRGSNSISTCAGSLQIVVGFSGGLSG